MGNSLYCRAEKPLGPKKRCILLIVDPQVDFHPGGSLAVTGANEDSKRTADMIRKHGNEIDEIYVTMDSHHRNHIAHAIFWTNHHGEHPSPFTLISYNDVKTGKWYPRERKHQDHALAYTKYLMDQGKFTLCIWPEHCLIGSPGHAVVPVINSALHEWAGLRAKEVHYILKGQNCLTEMYSAVRAEYVMSDDPSTERDYHLQAELENTDRLMVCGQALSHCVNFTFTDIMDTYPVSSRKNLVLLTDASSPVAGFEKEGQDFIQRVKQGGCRVATTMNVFANSS